ncbi:MAG: hypothetical protein M8357_12460 [Desulfobulbaceae bacterium]|nr:hypothetical protein [Desulfobulbaceae bacterium]
MSGVNPDIHFYIFGDNGVLFHPGVNRLWVLNPVAATIWCLLPENCDANGLQVELAHRFGISAVQAGCDVESCLDYFEREGLLAGGQPAQPDLENTLDLHLDDIGWQEPPDWVFETVLRAPGATVRLCSEDRKLGERFAATVQHLQDSPCVAGVQATIALVHEQPAGGWSVYLDGRRYASGVAENSVLPYIYSLFFVSASRGLDRYFLLHGAALAKNNGALLLPGVAGSGKTTLALLLAEQGWQLYSDELVVMDVDSGRVMPFPMPVSIKPGSVPILAPCYPELTTARVWERGDGQLVRYLAPAGNMLPASLEDRALPFALIFPTYTPQKGTCLQEIGKVEALQRLAATGSSNRGLRAGDVEAMIALAKRCPAYTLVFDDAGEAVRRILSVL